MGDELKPTGYDEATGMLGFKHEDVYRLRRSKREAAQWLAAQYPVLSQITFPTHLPKAMALNWLETLVKTRIGSVLPVVQPEIAGHPQD